MPITTIVFALLNNPNSVFIIFICGSEFGVFIGFYAVVVAGPCLILRFTIALQHCKYFAARFLRDCCWEAQQSEHTFLSFICGTELGISIIKKKSYTRISSHCEDASAFMTGFTLTAVYYVFSEVFSTLGDVQ